MLLGQDRRGRQHHHLPALAGRLERRPQRDLGLAVSDVAADQAVHRPLRLHVGLGLLDRLELVVGLAVGERALELELPVGVLRVGVARAPLALRVEVDQLARQLRRGTLRAGLHVVPGLGAELRERRRGALGAHVAAQTVELVGRHEDPVAVAVLDLEVVARHPGHRLGVEAGEAADPVLGVDHDVARAQLRERLEGATARALRALRAAPAQQAVVRDHGDLQLGRDEALAQPGLREPQSLADVLAVVGEARSQPRQVVRGALGLAAPVPGDDRRVAGAHQLLQLRLRLRDRCARRCRRPARGTGAAGRTTPPTASPRRASRAPR